MHRGLPDAVLAAALGDRAVTDVTRLGSRDSYGTFAVGVDDAGPLVLKCTGVAGWRLRKEAAVLRLVADVDGVPAPSVLAVGTAETADGEWTYLLATKCRGETGRAVCRDDPARLPGVLRAVGRVLARVHEGTSFPRPGNVVAGDDGAATLAPEPTTWPGVLAEVVESEAAILRDTAFERWAERALEVVETHRDVLADGPAPRLVHCDPNLRNVLVADGALSGLLDWEYAKAGDPAYDLAAVEARIAADRTDGGGAVPDDVDGEPSLDGFDRDALPDDCRTALLDGYRAVRPVPDGYDRRRGLYRVLFVVDRMVGLCGGSEAEAADPAVAESDAGRRLRKLARRRVEEVEGSR